MMSGAGLYVIYNNKEMNHFSHVRLLFECICKANVYLRILFLTLFYLDWVDNTFPVDENISCVDRLVCFC